MKTVIRRILIAVDGSRLSQRVAERGIQMAKQMKAIPILLYVVDKRYARDHNHNLELARKQLVMEGENILERLIEKMKVKPLTHVKIGIPEKEIIRQSVELEADFIVMGTHGRTGLQHLVMGSVAENVLKNSKRPVHIIPTHHHRSPHNAL